LFVKIAKELHTPLHVLLKTLPQWEFDVWATYFSREPPVEERIELLLASLHAMMSSKGRGAKKKVSDFLFAKDAWTYKPDSGNPDVDSDIASLMAAFASRLVIRSVN